MQYIQLNLNSETQSHSSFKVPFDSIHDIGKASKIILSKPGFHYTGHHTTTLIVTDVYYTETSLEGNLILDKTLMCQLEEENVLNVCMAVEYCMKYYKDKMIVGYISEIPDMFRPYLIAEKEKIPLEEATSRLFTDQI